jgi:lipoate-protein ligase A
LRWYGAEARALVLGTSQKLTDVDASAYRNAGVTLHRRASGGAAVLFVPAMLMQDIALPTGHRLFSADVTESYRWLGEVWLATLARLGLAVRLVSVAEARADTVALHPLLKKACFGGRSPYEVMVGERKLVGFSQVRRRQGALLQVGVYRRWQPQQLVELLALPTAERERLTELLLARGVGLDELTPAPVPFTLLAETFAAILSELHGISLVPSDWNEEERAAQAAALPKYQPLAVPE